MKAGASYRHGICAPTVLTCSLSPACIHQWFGTVCSPVHAPMHAVFNQRAILSEMSQMMNADDVGSHI